MKLLIRIGLFLAVVAGLAFVKFKYFAKDAELGTAPNPTAAGTKPNGGGAMTTVSGYVVKSEKLDNRIFATGSAVSSEMVDLKPEVAGKIIQLNISEGKPVSKGQLLIKLNDVDLQAQLRKLEAQLKLTQQSEVRLRKLLDIKGVSQDEYDVVTNQINNIKADMEYTEAQIAKTEIRAPFSGIIGLRAVSLGAYISGTSQVATIQIVNPMKIDFSIPEKYVNQVRLGDQITFGTEGSADKFTGKVYAIDNQIDPTTRTLKVRATAANSSGRLKPGAFVKVDFSLKEIDNALMIPTEAVVPILKGQQVFVSKNGKAQAVEIGVGVRTDSKIQVTSGLSVGDTIITSALMSMKNEMKVKFSAVK